MGEPVDTVRRIHDPPPLTAQEISAMQECMAMHGLPDGELAERMLATIVSLQFSLTAAQQRIADLEAQCARVQRDAERFEWFFGDSDKLPFMSNYLLGIRESWTPDQWRAAIDAAMAAKGAG